MSIFQRVTVCLLVFAAALGRAQSPCESRCNQQSSECLRKCSGDPKDASKPENAKKLMACLQQCEAEVKPCREACRK
ncbi:MAG: hypothetical protein SFW67_37430 [Myxococcaceae bacterium]|nr:hypothetical protein [Myxococcaceae bacterium]